MSRLQIDIYIGNGIMKNGCVPEKKNQGYSVGSILMEWRGNEQGI